MIVALSVLPHQAVVPVLSSQIEISAFWLAMLVCVIQRLQFWITLPVPLHHDRILSLQVIVEESEELLSEK